ncbi:hypothetical protein A2837_03475 [Candidatus Kaiserbacteria bacterium RIFCSPHIGHO2_01_FULL_46_22]|uniref:Uncharacterized protein n=1 Tax=Candidatus Kaiserbacteria bacterium RIFCSPHIGHO2_01_FULL_46_22 TaxID=1798475 RepID=A0A1F6BX62_9BACT|nr:MAG: hypothetical protein A2837_03475 [Candidatus Kaiserbacteria bacterium RIFCSPHIGHO2_01_FULL_46_22]
MCEKCDFLASRSDIVGVDQYSVAEGQDWWMECLRPKDHAGPHLIRRHSGEYIAWEYDEECDCPDCQSEDPNDRCLFYGEVEEAEAKLLIESATRGSPHKDVVNDYLLSEHFAEWSDEDNAEE